MKTLLKIFFVCALLAPALEANAQDVNTRTRQLRFYPVRAAADTAATVGNSGRMWYDFISNKFRGNVGGTNFTFGSGGGGGYTFTSGLTESAGTVRWGGTLTTDAFIDLGSSTFALTGGLGGNYLSYNSGFFSLRSFYSAYGGGYYSILANYPTGPTPYTEWMTNASGSRYGIQLRYGGVLANRNIDFVLAGVANLRIDNPAGTFFYTIGRSAITGNRTVTLPLLTADDTFVTAAFSQSLTNKTLGAGTVFSAAPTINDGLKFTFNPNGTNAGLNFGAHTANPSSPVNGDAYYNSTTNQLFAYINGAWVALGSGGGGFTNGAANNELIKSDGTNGVSSGIFAEVLAGGLTTTFGTGSTAGSFRDFIAAGSEANISFRFIPKGSGNITFQSATQITNTAPTSIFTSGISTISILASGREIRFAKTGTAAQSLISGADGISTDVNADSLVIEAGSAYNVSGNGNGGNIILKPGAGNGSGVDGIVYAKHQGYNISLTLFQPVSETGTSFTFDYSHLCKLVVGTNAATQTATVPALQVGYITKVVQDGAGVMNLSAGANVVLVGKTSTTGPGDTIVIHAYKTSGSDTYYLCE